MPWHGAEAVADANADAGAQRRVVRMWADDRSRHSARRNPDRLVRRIPAGFRIPDYTSAMDDQCMASNYGIVTGNAISEGRQTRGWFIGSFVQSDNALIANANVEVKWSIRAAGEEHRSSAGDGAVTTLAVLVKGAQILQFEDREVYLSQEGDYVLWHPHLPHKTVAVQDSIILVIRWPSSPAQAPSGNHPL